MSGQWLHGAEDSPYAAERRAAINAARAEAVLDFAQQLDLTNCCGFNVERVARAYVEAEGWPLPATSLTPREAVDELTRLSQEMGGYDLPTTERTPQ